MSAPCHQRYKETGLWFEILCLKNAIADKEKHKADASFEKGILKSYRKYSEGTYQRPPSSDDTYLGDAK